MLRLVKQIFQCTRTVRNVVLTTHTFACILVAYDVAFESLKMIACLEYPSVYPSYEKMEFREKSCKKNRYFCASKRLKQ